MPAMALSSRYQYGPLLCFFPSAGLLLERLRERTGRYGTALAAGAVACAALAAGLRWPREIADWADWRGTRTRDLLVQSNPARDGAPPNVPGLWTSNAREIVARFNLH
jgi:hypothetical protein